MSAFNQIDVQLINIDGMSTDLSPTATHLGETTINIQAVDGWTIIGQYKNSILQTITLKKMVTATPN